MKTVMITGATSGIGKELTENYARSGVSVIACGRSLIKLTELSADKPLVKTLCFDLNDFEHYPEPDEALKGELLDILILNAGDCEYIDDTFHFDAAKFHRVININLVAVAYGLKAWLRYLKPGGRVVLMSSSAGLLPLPRAEAYGASKAALTYLARTLSITLKPHGVKVTVVHPGFVDTPLTRKNTFSMPMLMNSREAAEKIVRGLNQGRQEICVPSLFVFIMKCLRLLPHSLWQRLANRMV